jgi:hypothetical protein
LSTGAFLLFVVQAKIEGGKIGGQANCRERIMREVLRTNDPVLISYVQSLLKDDGIESMVFDGHAAVVEGSIGAIQRRIMVLDEDAERARRLIVESEVDG